VVAADNWSGAHALVAHLVNDHGKRRLCHFDGPATAPDANARRLAMHALIDASPGAMFAGTYSGLFSVRSGEEAAERLLADSAVDGALPDAIVCANDQMAIGALRVLTSRGFRVPQDVAVVGFDDIYPASFADVPLTTVHQPMRQLGERSCERLVERIADPGLPPEVTMLPTELVIRSSCGCPPGTVTRRPAIHIPQPEAVGLTAHPAGELTIER
jgi:LacI family transcriptional regulator